MKVEQREDNSYLVSNTWAVVLKENRKGFTPVMILKMILKINVHNLVEVYQPKIVCFSKQLSAITTITSVAQIVLSTAVTFSYI